MSGIIDYGLITGVVDDGIYTTGDIPSLTSSEFKNIRVSLESRFNGLDDITNKFFENTEFDLATLDKGEDGISFAVATLLPNTTETSSMGSTGQDMHTGTFRVDYYHEVGDGAFVASEIDVIANAFSRGTVLTTGTTVLRIKNVSIGAGRREDAFYVRPIEATYYAVTPARS
mgnify:CR=1 FL=1